MAIQADHKDIINLIMGDLTQFHIPIYQRTYTWEANDQVDKLMDDIIEFGNEYKDNTRAEYYIGNVIVKNQTRGLITERVVIDGQQRITTSVLFLCAIRDIYLHKYISDEGNQTARNIHKILYSQEGTEVKLKLNNMENQQALTNLLSASGDETSYSDKQTRYVKNYNHIHKRLSRMGEEKFNEFLGLLKRVKVVVISLDEDQDENSVFESINSLGKPLAGSDLIKNYLFTFKNYECDHESEVRLTNKYTRSFEVLFKDEDNIEEELESFFRSYIAVKTQWLVKKDPKILYYSFKKYIGDITTIDMCEGIIRDLAKWALIYQTIRVRHHPDIDFNHMGYMRTSFGIYVTLLMEMLDKYSHIESNELIVDDKNGFNEVLKALVAYDASRFIANYPTGELTRFIPMVFNRISNDFTEYGSYAERFTALVSSAAEGYRIPSIEVLKKSVISNDLYSRKRQKIKKILILLENIGKKEIVNYEKDLRKSQIEHVMPQTPATGKWSYISIEDHEKYLHTLGNLTLTYDNQKLGNMGFSEKKEILIEKSRIILNQSLSSLEEFGIPEIEARANELLNTFVEEYLNIV